MNTRWHLPLPMTPHDLPDILPLLGHELWTPLAAIKGFTALLLRYQEQLSAHEQHDLIQEIAVAEMRLEHAIAQTLQLYELLLGQADVTPVALDLAQLLQTTLEGISSHPGVQRTRNAANLTQDSPDPCWVSGDPQLLRLLLTEVVQMAQALSASDDPLQIVLQRRPDVGSTTLSGIPHQWWNVAIHLVESHLAPEQLTQVLHPRVDDTTLLVEGSSHITLNWMRCRLITMVHAGLLWIEPSARHDHTLHLALPAVASSARRDLW